MAWTYLLIAAVLEIIWAAGMKYTAGFTRMIPTVIVLSTAYASFHLLSLAVKAIPVGTAYAVWTGIGAVGTAIFGMIWFAESRDVLRLSSIALIVMGVLGLRVFSK